MMSVFILRTDHMTPATATSFGIIGVSGLVTIVGAVVWGVFYRRMERLAPAEGRYFVLGPRRSIGLRGAGAGLELAF
jgi:hypothetical protein